MKAMCANLPQRYSSATQMLEDLETFRANPEVVFPYGQFAAESEMEPEVEMEADESETYLPPVPPKRSKTPAVAILVMVLVVVGIAVWFLNRFLFSDLLGEEEKLIVPPW